MKYHFKICKEKKGFSAQCMELKGCITEGDSLKELFKNMKEALNLYIQEPEDSQDLALLLDVPLLTTFLGSKSRHVIAQVELEDKIKIEP